MHLSNGKKFTITAKNISDENIYVQSVELNGKNWASPFLPYKELKNGGSLVFSMGAHPSAWGTEMQLSTAPGNVMVGATTR
jgi:putative alpha-1,2-mannosidase